MPRGVRRADGPGLVRRLLVGLAAALAAAAPLAVRAGPEALPPQHWAYGELEHFEARGLLRLHGSRPYSRHEVRTWVESIADTLSLSRVERARLERLQAEFVRGDSLEHAAVRQDPPLFRLLEAGWGFAGDVELSSGGAQRSAGPDPSQTWGLTRLETQLRYRDWLAYETRYSVALREEEGRRTGENVLSSRERTWHGLTSDHDRACIAVERGRVRAVLGRDYLGWGARRGEELLVSDSGLSLDALQLRLRLGRFRLSSAAAQLSAERDRFYAAHRLEVELGPLALGVQEAVVYRSPHPDAAYLFPISFYYGNQFNERADDNVLLGGDLKCVGRWGVLDGELLVDDFIYDGDPAPNKFGWRAGWTHARPVRGTDLELRLEYVRLARWTYTHKQGHDVYWVAGSGDPGAGDPFLGHPLGPDADRWSARADWAPHADWGLWGRGAGTRRGAGNLQLDPWQTGTPHDVPFPSGDVRHEWEAEIGARGRWRRRAEARLAVALVGEPEGRATRLWAELRLDL
jgi:hypothetical protein